MTVNDDFNLIPPNDKGKRIRSSRRRRTYFAHPLIEESLEHLPAALKYQTSVTFRQYLMENLHYNSQNTRKRFAKYISHRFSTDGRMNLNLARAIKQFDGSTIGREILYFELVRSVPLLMEIAVSWLAELPEEGARRKKLITFLEARLGGRSSKEVAQSATMTFKRCGKMISPKLSVYRPVWSSPSLEAFLYVLTQLYPEPTMVRVDLFAGEPILRAMLWPRPCIEDLLCKAQQAGHISKVSHLDQYHQFTLNKSGAERLDLLLRQEGHIEPGPPDPKQQMSLFADVDTAEDTSMRQSATPKKITEW